MRIFFGAAIQGAHDRENMMTPITPGSLYLNCLKESQNLEGLDMIGA